MRLVHGSLFSGFDAPSVAASWMGWENAFHCEINHFCNEILKYWFPNSEHYEDITKTDFSQWKGRIDVLTGGFPCQPFSIAGKRKGADDNRYLWPHMLRAIREIRPTWVIGENVAGILTMVQPGEEIEVGNQPSFFGEDDRKRVLLRQEYVIETICKDLEREGYSVQPMLIPACAVGAPHRRDRVWIIANRTDTGTESMQQTGEDGVNDAVTASDTERIGRSKMDYQVQPEQPNGNRADCNGFERFVADTDSNRRWWWKDKQEQFSECEGTSDNCVGCEDGLITYSDGLRNTPCKESERTERSRRRHFPQQSQRRDTPERTNGLMDYMDFMDMLPTPRANKVNSANLNSPTLAQRNKGNLEESIAKAIQQKQPSKTGKTSQLNPLFVEEMMGFPLMYTTLPFLSRNGDRNRSKDTETP